MRLETVSQTRFQTFDNFDFVFTNALIGRKNQELLVTSDRTSKRWKSHRETGR
jgi:hypothetical protein